MNREVSYIHCASLFLFIFFFFYFGNVSNVLQLDQCLCTYLTQICNYIMFHLASTTYSVNLGDNSHLMIHINFSAKIFIIIVFINVIKQTFTVQSLVHPQTPIKNYFLAFILVFLLDNWNKKYCIFICMYVFACRLWLCLLQLVRISLWEK